MKAFTDLLTICRIAYIFHGWALCKDQMEFVVYLLQMSRTLENIVTFITNRPGDKETIRVTYGTYTLDSNSKLQTNGPIIDKIY